MLLFQQAEWPFLWTKSSLAVTCFDNCFFSKLACYSIPIIGDRMLSGNANETDHILVITLSNRLMLHGPSIKSSFCNIHFRVHFTWRKYSRVCLNVRGLIQLQLRFSHFFATDDMLGLCWCGNSDKLLSETIMSQPKHGTSLPVHNLHHQYTILILTLRCLALPCRWNVSDTFSTWCSTFYASS